MKINTRHEYYLAMAQIELLLEKGLSALSEAEDENLAILSKSAEDWELKEYPMPMNPAVQDILNYIMYQRKINQTQLSQQLKISKAALSEILSGKKKPNLDVAKELHASFEIDGNLILESI
jgi:HTH-type transcriptional regulator/antitoxin HigA